MEFWALLIFTICLVCATIFVWERLHSGGGCVSLRPLKKTRHLKCFEELLKSVTMFSEVCGSMEISGKRCQFLCECLKKVTIPHFTLKESFCAIRRALKLMEDCRSENWLLKALEFGDCQLHFLEILLDLHRLPIIEALIGSGGESLDDMTTKFRSIDISKKTETDLKIAWESDKVHLSSKLKSVEERDRWLANQLEPTAKPDDILIAPAEIGKYVTEFDALDKYHILHRKGKTAVFRVTLDRNRKCVIKADFGSAGAEVPEDSKDTKLEEPGFGSSRTEVPEDSKDKEKTLNEADFMKLCRHPYAVALLGFWERTKPNGPRVPLILMESMECDLDEIIKGNKSRWWWPWGCSVGFPALVAINLMLPLAKVMKHLHEIRVVHLDLKPKNILLARVPGTRGLPEDVSVKLADFGDALMATDVVKGQVGTPGYTDPDVYMSAENESVDLVKADVFSFGMVFGEVLTGKSPMEALGCEGWPSNKFYGKLLKGERVLLPEETPICVKSIVESCWDPKPDKRPSFAQICWELQWAESQLLNGRT